MKDKEKPEVIWMTPYERMSELAGEIAYLTNLSMLETTARDDRHLISIKIRELEKEKRALYEHFGGGEKKHE